MDDEVLSLLKLAASEDPDTSQRASETLIMVASLFPEQVFMHMGEIKLVLASLCCANCVRWGTISAIFLAFANGINTNPLAVETHVVELIEMSKMVTKAYLFTPSLSSSYRPHLLPLVHAMNKALLNNIFKLSLEALLALSDHASIGFVPNASYMPLMVAQTNEVLQIMKNSEPVHYERLCDPISSTDKDVVLFYVSVWAILVGRLHERPTIFRALSRKMKWLVELVAENKYPYVMPARYIVDFVKASQQEADELAASWKPVSESAFNSLDALRRPIRMEIDADVTSEQPAEEAAEEKRQQQPLTIFVEVVKAAKPTGKRGTRCELILLPDARILMWAKKGREAKEGDAIQLSDITCVEFIQPPKSTGEVENIVKLTTKRTGVILLYFPSYHTAVQWKKYIQSGPQPVK